ncbi:MAG: AAA domain-containing protein [Gemmatimonadetes bacterium]|nr:AAA domain-containing protein [Gemmatimonadota bacterium]MYI60564.1 AAA domain-containing protein [Gemmatimonadota bacterium]
MREIYQWTEWFSELAGKIAEGGEEFLIDRAKQIDWEAAGKKPPLLRDENIDPFSFFYTLAQRRSSANRKLIYRSVENVFNVKHQYSEEQYDSNDAFVFPTPSFKILFQGDPQLLWNLFRSAVRGLDSVDSKHFDGVFNIHGVGKAKLTQTLFLINSSQFLPCDDKLKTFVDLPPDDEFNWKSYREWLQQVRDTDTFRGLEPYEINFSAYRLSQKGTPPNSVKHPLNQILYGPPGTGKTYHTVARALAVINGESVEEIERNIDRFRELRDSGQIAMVTFHQNFAYEDFIEGIRPTLGDEADGQIRYELRDGIFKQIAEAAKEEKGKRFVLIIDEINRGNIAKIFGELITLIEDSRRLGADDETKVLLPYSNESFGVPNNLYLIGTMNTADRSIQLLDTALRRRFDFIEMMPKPEFISDNVEGVNCKRMLKAMNKRITALLDREHQIGHTYLLDIDTMKKLSYVFQNKIFPLLQEYFFDDWAKIRAVLGGNSFVVEQSAAGVLRENEQVDEDRTIYERLPGDDDRWTDLEEYKKIYNAGNAEDTSNP